MATSIVRRSLAFALAALAVLVVEASTEKAYVATKCRKYAVSLADFGGVGDGKTSNTKAFQDAIKHLSGVASDGGGLLYIPPGKWVTGSFNLTSHFTLYLHNDAVILGSTNKDDWPIIAPLPSYGTGRDIDGPRYSSLIMGFNLTDVIITGDNGTIDGQGESWWKQYRANELKYTRGYMVELQYTDQILISNLTFLNSPSWNLHPVYSSNVIISGVTVLAPVDSPNTDGIDPGMRLTKLSSLMDFIHGELSNDGMWSDSSSQVLIEDSYIVSGDDCVAIKSGWDEYGIAVNMPSKHISIKRLTCISPDSAVIAIGSEMSGGVVDVRAEHVTAMDSESGIRLKTAVGRGGYMKDIYARNFHMQTMKWAFWMTGSYGSHPGDHYDPKAIPLVRNIQYSDMVVGNATMAAKLEGIEGAQFTDICLSNITIDVRPSKKLIWNCTNVAGWASEVKPTQCKQLQGVTRKCRFPTDTLAIERVEFNRCQIEF